jgi:predicted transposase YdaD
MGHKSNLFKKQEGRDRGREGRREGRDKGRKEGKAVRHCFYQLANH